MVEARYLRAYRRDLHVSMQQLRPFIASLRAEFGVPYPLAHFKPFIDRNRRYHLELQHASEVPSPLRIVYELKTGQTILNPLLQENYLDRIESHRRVRRLDPLRRMGSWDQRRRGTRRSCVSGRYGWLPSLGM